MKRVVTEAFVPLGASEAGSVENLPRLFTMLFKGVAEVT
jgi:hypothetical protein